MTDPIDIDDLESMTDYDFNARFGCQGCGPVSPPQARTVSDPLPGPPASAEFSSALSLFLPPCAVCDSMDPELVSRFRRTDDQNS